MNILTEEQLRAGILSTYTRPFAISARDIAVSRAIEAAVLAKLAEQDMEPSFWLCRGELFEVEQRFFPPNNGPIPGQEKLYTETQLLAAQQRTAEACLALAESKHANGNFRFTHQEEISEAIRNGDWREYL